LVGREVSIGYGEAIVTSGAEVSATTIAASRFVTFRVPSKAVAPLVPDIDDRIARPIRRGNEALLLLTGYGRWDGSVPAAGGTMLQFSHDASDPPFRAFRHRGSSLTA
jgi:hypothetical protein